MSKQLRESIEAALATYGEVDFIHEHSGKISDAVIDLLNALHTGEVSVNAAQAGALGALLQVVICGLVETGMTREAILKMAGSGYDIAAFQLTDEEILGKARAT